MPKIVVSKARFVLDKSANPPSAALANIAAVVQTNRVALVTGANKGIGLEIARQLAQAGIFVITGARDRGRASAAVDDLTQHGLSACSVQIDLNDAASIAAAAEMISSEQGGLDILVNNAGIVDAEDGPPSIASPEAVRRIMDTNFVGTLAVTQATLPLLRRLPAARIANLYSSLGSLTLNGDPTSPYYSAGLIGYNASKAALNMLTIQLSEELRDTGIVVNSVSPGYVKTDLTGHNGVLTAEQGAALPVEYAPLGEAAVSGRFVQAGGATPW